MPSNGRCTQCRTSKTACTFDLPIARRGPKAKKRRNRAASNSPEAEDSSLIQFDDDTIASPNDTTVWEAIATTPLVNHHVSPQSSSVVGNIPPIFDIGVQSITPSQRWHQLSTEISIRGLDFETLLNQCVDLFFDHLYPLTPLVHEPSFRQDLAYFLPGEDRTMEFATASDVAFTMVTAVCAEAAFLVPKDIFPQGEKIADVFLQASRACLNSYLESDLEHPTANSVTVRYFHSNCVHAAGRPKYSWHIFGEATRLAQAMRLHDNSTYEDLYPVEAEMRRRVFWIVYMGDKSAAILNDRPITMHKYSFESGITASYPHGLEEDDSCLPPVSPESVLSLPPTQSLILGFNANIRLWQAASDLFLAIRVIEDARNAKEQDLTVVERCTIDPLYIAFMTCLDDLPEFLQPCDVPMLTRQNSTRSNQLLIQCANLQISLHCLRMVTMQRFEQLGYLSSSIGQIDLQKTDVARELLRFMKQIPFWALQVNGEPYVRNLNRIICHY